MITEKHLALAHSGFWHEVMPMAEAYVRSRNRSPGRSELPLYSALAAGERGLVNEVGFQIFARAMTHGVTPSQISGEETDACVQASYRHVQGLRQLSRTPLAPITAAGLNESIELADRLKAFFRVPRWRSVQPKPVFPGCGWLDEAAGDVLADSILFEIKAGDRAFRSADLRQLLCYCAMNCASKRYGIVGVCLLNPRRGVFIQEDLETLCAEVSGASAAEVLGEIVEYVSEPLTGYRTP